MKVSLVVIYIIVVIIFKKYNFYVSEADIGRCYEIYFLEVNAEPATRDKNSIIIDVGRGLHPSLLPTELS